MILLDGAIGEGGGQVLRTALTLSILTRKSFCIQNIRAGRKQPGLLAQHLRAVDAAAAISRASVQGARLGSLEITFEPGEIRSGRYRFDIGTAGSTSLVLQTVLLPLSSAGSASSVILTGGTHTAWAPAYPYIETVWMPFMSGIGLDADLALDRAGFYPEGGGRISATIRPLKESLRTFNALERGKLKRIFGISAVANLSDEIAIRQKRQAVQRLLEYSEHIQIKLARLSAQGRGTVVFLAAEFESVNPQIPWVGCGYTALGAPGKRAERVADEAVDALIHFMDSNAAVDEYLADQMLLPLSQANGESRYSTARLTQHLITGVDVLSLFLNIKITISGELGRPAIIHIQPVSQE